MEDQSQSADADVALFLLWLMAGIAIVVLTISGFASSTRHGWRYETLPLPNPRGIRECTFEVRTPITTIETRGHAVLYMVCVVGFCVLCGLLIAGVL